MRREGVAALREDGEGGGQVLPIVLLSNCTQTGLLSCTAKLLIKQSINVPIFSNHEVSLMTERTRSAIQEP